MASRSRYRQRLGHRFSDLALMRRALTHTSYVNEQPEGSSAADQLDNERLEFLGDAVLQLSVVVAF